MRRLTITLVLFALAAGHALGDGIILKDGRKLSGKVVEKPDGYEITVEGQTSGYPKDQIIRIVKSPREVLGDADRQVEDAKKIYSEAVVMTDEKAADAKFREALPKVQKAREAYVEARELFPENYPELDDQLVNIMKLMRLVRERIHSKITDNAAPPVKAKSAPPPKMGSKPVQPLPEPVKAAAPTVGPKPQPATPQPPPPPPPTPAPTELPPEPVRDPRPGEGTPEAAEGARVVDAPPAMALKEALAILVTPARRADAKQRAEAKTVFRKLMETEAASADVATAGWLLLSKSDADWGLLTDAVTVKTTGAPVTYRGELEKRSDVFSSLVLADRREVRVRTAKDGMYVTVPGGVEVKAVDCRIETDQPSDAFDALQAFFKGVGDAASLETLEGREVSEGVKFLALKVRELRAKNVSAEAPALFVAGVASALIHRQKGKPTLELEAAFKDLGFEKSEFGAVWGRKEGLAMDDYRKWLASGEYNMGVIQFYHDYRDVADPPVRYAAGLLHLFRALAQNRDYYKAAAYLDAASSSLSPSVRDHFAALAKSIRELSPCNICGGTHKLNCNVCKGKIKINLQCNQCGGAGKINQLRGGIGTCPTCNGAGRFNNVDCLKCKAAGTIECKGRGCVKAVAKPTFESFADAFQCPSCQSRGSLMRHVAFPCGDCGGIGLVIQAKADPTKLFR